MAQRQSEPAAEARHNKYVVGVWHGATPPTRGQWVSFEPGKARVEERGITPVVGETKAPGPEDLVLFVLGGIMSRGMAMVSGWSIDKDALIQRAEALEREAGGK